MTMSGPKRSAVETAGVRRRRAQVAAVEPRRDLAEAVWSTAGLLEAVQRRTDSARSVSLVAAAAPKIPRRPKSDGEYRAEPARVHAYRSYDLMQLSASLCPQTISSRGAPAALFPRPDALAAVARAPTWTWKRSLTAPEQSLRACRPTASLLSLFLPPQDRQSAWSRRPRARDHPRRKVPSCDDFARFVASAAEANLWDGRHGARRVARSKASRWARRGDRRRRNSGSSSRVASPWNADFRHSS